MNAEPNNPFNVFLIGYRCTGKSSVGKALSARLQWPFVDTDSLLVSERKMSIKEIVDTYGWKTFRQMEHAVVKRICRLNRRVVATGGGIVLDEANVDLMQASGRLVWLTANPETIKSRMLQDKDSGDYRPALTEKGSLAEIEKKLIERDPYYKQAMDFFVETDGRQVSEICGTIVRQLSKLNNDKLK